jgi:hypothetical protein
MSTKTAKIASPRPLSSREITAIRNEALRLLAIKAEREINDYRKSARDRRGAKAKAELAKALKSKTLLTGLKSALSLSNEDLNSISSPRSILLDKISCYFNTALQGVPGSDCYTREEAWVDAPISTKLSRRSGFFVPAPRAKDYNLLIEELSRVEINCILGGDAKSVFDSILKRIEQL